MSKILKAIAMLLVIAAVVFAAGCANKAATPANGSNASATVTPAGTPTIEVTPSETPVETTNNTENVTENVTENATENVTENMAENNTSTPAASGAVHLSTAARHAALIKSQQQANSTENVTQ